MGRTIYSNDDRVQIVHPNRSDSMRNHKRDDWILQLRDTSPSDSGIYECQINTEPKKSKAYILHVVGMCPIFTLDFLKQKSYSHILHLDRQSDMSAFPILHLVKGHENINVI